MRLVLASTSPYRRSLLERLGLPFETASPEFDEVGAEGLPPAEVAKRYAEGKARSLAERYPDALVVGSDQVLDFEGRQLRKPADLGGAADQLLLLAGKTHSLHTAVAVLDTRRDALELEVARVDLTLLPLTRPQAERYVALDQPHGCVGGYTYEGRGVALFADVQGADESAVVGLPLILLCQLLRRHGLDPRDRWESP
jgi:septum formation protein